MWLQTGKPFGQQIENDPEAYFLLGSLSPEERRLIRPDMICATRRLCGRS